MQCVAVCCSLRSAGNLQDLINHTCIHRDAVYCSVLQRVAACCSHMMLCVAVCCSVLQFVAVSSAGNLLDLLNLTWWVTIYTTCAI